MTGWLATAEQKYGGALSRQAPIDPSSTHLAAIAGPGAGEAAHPLLSVHSPVTWLLAIGAATVGLAMFSTTVRVGPASASVKLG